MIRGQSCAERRAPAHPHSHDPLVNAATGQPCKGKRAAAALAALVHDPEARSVLALRFPHLFARAESALSPFDLSKLFAVETGV